MTSLKYVAASLTLACALLPAISRADDDVAALRAELEALKGDYAARLAALEARIEELSAAAPTAGPAVAQDAPPPGASLASAASAFNPAISVILTGNYTSLSQDPESWTIAGFLPSGGEVGPGERSFNLAESELVLSANVDPYFSATLIAAITPEDEIEVEEAYFRTSSLPAGFTAKGGRFFSGFGYLNEVHAHAWDFIDQPLVYQAMFANQRGQDGLQLKWLAPTDLFLELGVEAGNGEAFPATRRDRNGLNGTTLFAHVGGDLGESTSWRAGASWLDMDAEERAYEDVDLLGNPVLNAFTGSSRTWAVDAVVKWRPYGDASRRELKLQGEYFRRKENGDLTLDLEGAGLDEPHRSEQSGWYLQGVYQFQPRWRAGLRYDALDSGIAGVNPDRITTMLDWSPSEFSRIRAQYSWDDARATGDKDRQFRLQYIYGIGAHGAHKY
ncbi:MAG TPA: hypothetical protein VFR29_03615 [Steroidobacteraceae bacterium]|nr:hypothetical protein [Steroidobacteraceae bacterium]